MQLKTYAGDGSLARTWNLTDVRAPGGKATLDLGEVPRDRRVEADVLVQTGAPARTYVVRGATTTLLRPDLVVELKAPLQTLTMRPADVSAVVTEQNGDVGATASLTFSYAPGAPKQFEIGPGGTVEIPLGPLTLADPVPVHLSVNVEGRRPARRTRRTTPRRRRSR